MPKHTLQELFGASATQTATTITITKADFATLAASVNNTGSQLFSALLLRAKDIATQAAYDADTTKTIYASAGFSSFTTRGTISSRNDQITFNLTKPDSSAVLDPDDY
jgi:hypothetical protein